MGGFVIPVAALAPASPDGILSASWNSAMKKRWSTWIAAILLWSALGTALPVADSFNQQLEPCLGWFSRSVVGLLTPLIVWTDARLA